MSLTVTIGGRRLTSWQRCEVVRDLADITGSFEIDYLDQGRADQALQQAMPADLAPVRENDAVLIAIDGETVLRGWVDDVSLRMDGQTFSASISGRDVAGDLVDCSANPQGPGEYRSIGLLDVASALCAPFGITVRADTDLGATFGVVAIEPGETVMAVLEKLARQRGVLITSDGIGGLVLTQAGRSRAPAPVKLPGNVLAMDARLSARGLYSDVWVKGQFRSLKRPAKVVLDSSVTPLGATPPPPQPVHTPVEAAAIVRYGHAIDADVRRYRPRVWVSATQSGGSVAAQDATDVVEDTSGQSGVSGAAYHGRHRKGRRKPMKPRTDASPWTLQDQADWRMRSMRAQAQRHDYVVLGHRAGGVLWRPNALTALQDAYAGISADMLIGGVTFMAGEDGYRTRLHLVDPDSYNLQGDEDGTHNGRRRAAHARATDTTARRYR